MAKLLLLLKEAVMSNTTDLPIVSKGKKKTNPRTRRNVINLDPKRIKESYDRKWRRELDEFLTPLSDREIEIVKETLSFALRRPSKRKQSCEVIQFAKGFNHKNSVN